MSVLSNTVRAGFYMDSVALMRMSRALSDMPGVERAALMIGSNTNKKLLQEAGLSTSEGDNAGSNDLIIAVRAENEEALEAALAEAQALINKKPAAPANGSKIAETYSLAAALKIDDQRNIALISVPGEFAAEEARQALDRGLHVMMFSDNVSISDEIELKKKAIERGLMMMGPDCGTAIIGGTPLAFANVVARGNIGIIAASGTGLQEVATLLDRGGAGISHAIGVGGRDLKDSVGGLMTLAAIQALDRDPETSQIVLISKPPGPDVARRILERVGQSEKPFSICFIGGMEVDLPSNARLSSDLRTAAENALDDQFGWSSAAPDARTLAAGVRSGRSRVQALYTGGTLCAEAQVFFQRDGMAFTSNVPIPGVADYDSEDTGDIMLDLGNDEYTAGRPHPMIDPSLRNELLQNALDSEDTGIILLDLVIGYGAHADPAGDLVAQLPPPEERNAILIASVCGTEADPQSYSRQRGLLEKAGIIVAPSNAHAAELAISITKELRA